MSKIQIKFDKFKKVLSALEAIYLKPVTQDRINIDATIQRFEFTVELAWKFLKAYFEEKGILLNFPKEIFKEAFAANLIDNESIWIQMLLDRNMTSHTYDEALADAIYRRIRDYVPELRKLLNAIAQALTKQ